MSTNTLIEQQRHIFQQLQKVTNDYLGEVEEAETRRENGIQMAVAKRDQAQAIVNTQLEEMRQMLVDARETAKGWKSKIENNFMNLSSQHKTNANIKMEMAEYHSKAKQVNDEITAFIKDNSESGNTTCLGSIAAIVLGLVSCVGTGGIWAAVAGHGTTDSIPFAIIIGLIIAFVIFAIAASRDATKASKIRNLFATLETTISDAESLLKLQLNSLN